jgi:hypothetical protein
MEMSWSTPIVEDCAWDLVGRAVVAASKGERDPILEFSDGSVFELSATAIPIPGPFDCPGLPS